MVVAHGGRGGDGLVVVAGQDGYLGGGWLQVRYWEGNLCDGLNQQ